MVDNVWGWKTRESRLVEGLSVVLSIIDYDVGKYTSLYNSIQRGFFNGDGTGAWE